MNTEFENLMTGLEFKKLLEKKCEGIMKKYDLRKVELDVLYYISRGDRLDTAKDIISRSHISKAHISKSVDNLKQRGFIELQEDERDHRCIHLLITKNSLPVLAAYEQVHQEFQDIIFKNVTEGEKKCIYDVAKKIIYNLNQEYEREI